MVSVLPAAIVWVSVNGTPTDVDKAAAVNPLRPVPLDVAVASTPPLVVDVML